MNTGLASAPDEIATAKELLLDERSRASTILPSMLLSLTSPAWLFMPLSLSPHLEQSLHFKDEDKGGLGEESYRQRKSVRRVRASSFPIWHTASL